MSHQRVALCHSGLGGPWLDRIRAACGSWAIVTPAPEKSSVARDAILDSDVVVGWPDVESLLASRIRFFQCGSTGYEAYTGRGLETKRGFTMSNSAGTMSIPVAEHGLALMLAGTRNLARHAQDQTRRHYERCPPYREVFGTTACICGVGSIGTEIARRCAGLGMKLIGVRRNAGQAHEFIREIHPLDRLATAVAKADHVFIVLPLDGTTHSCFDARIFAAMKRGAAIYSLSRGAHIVEADLVAALRSGQVGFAGLDVFTEEPLRPESELWSAPNTLLTPHCSGRSEHEFRRMCELVIDNLERFHTGRPLRNVVMQNP